MGITRIVVALALAAVATAMMVNMDEYATNMFRNTTQSWFGAQGETVAMGMAGLYAAVVFAVMYLISYTTIYIFESGIKE
jgi:hypothetical protein